MKKDRLEKTSPSVVATDSARGAVSMRQKAAAFARVAIFPRGFAQRAAYCAASGVTLGLTVVFPSVIGSIIEWLAPIPAALALFSYTDFANCRVVGRTKGAPSANGDFSSGETRRGGVREVRRRKNGAPALGGAYSYGLAFFLPLYLTIYHWFLSMYPLDFAGLGNAASLFVVLLAWCGLSLLASVSGAFVFWGFAVFRRICDGRQYLLPPAAGVAYAIFEWAQNFGTGGVPWCRLAMGQINGGISLGARSSAVLGSYFVAFCIVCASFYAALALRSIFEVDADNEAARGEKNAHGARRTAHVRHAAIACLATVFADLLLGLCAIVFAPTSEATLCAAALQVNVSSAEKWSEDSDDLDICIELVGEAASRGADLALLPETALPYDIECGDSLDLCLCALSQKYDIALVVGCFETVDDGKFNALRFYENGEYAGSYYKRHLVPFGEYVPWRELVCTLVPALSEISMLDDDVTPGDGAQNVFVCGAEFGALICFDSIYASAARESANEGAELLFVSTNDSWFRTSRALDMHLTQARLRAIECGRDVLRAANTGISAIISADGNVSVSVPVDERGIAFGEVSVYSSRTPYTVIGDAFVYIALAFYLALALFFVCRRARRVQSG